MGPSMRERKGSYRGESVSGTVLPASLTNFRRALLAGIGREFCDVEAGMRKGRIPVGEAWLLDGRRVNGMRAIRRYVCHFRHVGLKLGRPAAASSGVLKT